MDRGSDGQIKGQSVSPNIGQRRDSSGNPSLEDKYDIEPASQITQRALGLANELHLKNIQLIGLEAQLAEKREGWLIEPKSGNWMRPKKDVELKVEK